jgi:O-antigen ligase
VTAATSPRDSSRAIALLLAALVVASVAAFDPWGFAPFGPMKLLVMVATAVGAAILALLRRGAGNRLHRAIVIAWLMLFASMVVATLLALDPLHAWIGTPDRRLGLAAWIVFALAFIAGAALTAHEGRVVARAAAIAGLAAGAYAALELANAAPVHLEFAGGRLGGAYGQPAYLGAAMVLLVPIAAGLAADRGESRAWRVIAGAGALSGTFALLGSQTRATWVGLAVAGVFALVASRPARAALLRAWPIVVAAAVLLVAVAVITPIGGRAASIFDTGNGTARGRVDEWQVATRALFERPLTGAGPEGYRIVFPGVVDAAYERQYGREVVPDRAHNGALDVSVTGGGLAALAYLALASLVVMAAWRVLRAPGAPWLAGVAIGAVAYLVQQQFLFPLAEVDPMFWAFAGLLLANAAPLQGERSASRPSRTARLVTVPVALAGLVVCLALAKEVMSDRELERAVEANASADHRSALAAADHATRLRPDSVRNWFVAGRIAARGDTIIDIGAALDRIESGLRRSPRDPILRTEHASLLLEWARRSERPADQAKAVAELEQLVADDPNNAEHHLQLGLAHALGEDFDAATEQLLRAKDLAPKSDAPTVDLALVEGLRRR